MDYMRRGVVPFPNSSRLVALFPQDWRWHTSSVAFDGVLYSVGEELFEAMDE